MLTLFSNHAVFHHQNDVRVADRGQAMGDDKTGAVRSQRGHRPLDQNFGACVHGTGGLIEDEQGRVGQEGTGDGQQLFSPALMLLPSSSITVS